MQVIWWLLVQNLSLNTFLRTLENLEDFLENGLIAGLKALKFLGFYFFI